ncbi:MULTISPECIES: dipeptide/oligopeptide/nickel ABC transporter permease/ATP-binding protein [Amycolatopsis]|uniref:Dipeptide/oligopeptide/nickel ABC transporter permease/ATP-binding protein n=1 Tax=Amycolatopsis albidoflavus TaxID=102226 RepID=A0ABW5HS55_9PSEU
MARRKAKWAGNAKTAIGLVLIGGFALLAIVGPWVAPYDPSQRSADLLSGPSSRHWFGTTSLGQDIFSQVLVGARGVMLIGFGAAAVATMLAVAVGVSAGYFGGWTDEGLSLLSNVFLVLPAVPLAIIVSSLLHGASDLAVLLMIGCTSWAWGARVLRAQTLSLRRRDYVEAARSVGEPARRIIGFEIVPNLTAVITSSFVGNVMFAVMAELVLAFVGVSGTSDWNWGTILFWAQSQQALAQGAWWWFVPVGLAIALLGTALSLLSFGVDEFVNPRLRETARHRVRTWTGRAVRIRGGFTPVLELVTQAGAEDDAVLRVERLSVDYGVGEAATTAVREVSFTLRRGEVLGIAGESGSGKSSLVQGIARLLPPPAVIRSGSVRYFAPAAEPVEVLALTPAELRAFRWEKLAIVFQSAMSSLNPVHKISAQLTDVLATHRPGMTAAARRERAAELLRLVGIPPNRLGSYPHELSGGMRQRVMIGMALALEPEIVILDEPTTALDVVTQRQILLRLTSLQKRLGFSVVFVTHDLALLAEFADRVALMYGGRVCEVAPVAELVRAPAHPYGVGLLSSFPELSGPRRKLTGIAGTPPDPRTMPSGCAYHPRCPRAFDGCAGAVPELLPLGPGKQEHAVACWLHQSGRSVDRS